MKLYVKSSEQLWLVNALQFLYAHVTVTSKLDPEKLIKKGFKSILNQQILNKEEQLKSRLTA